MTNIFLYGIIFLEQFPTQLTLSQKGARMQEPSLFDTPEEIAQQVAAEKAKVLDEKLQRVADGYIADRKDISSTTAFKLIFQFNESHPKEKMDIALYKLLEPKIILKINLAKELYEAERKRKYLPKNSSSYMSPSAKHFQERRDIFD